MKRAILHIGTEKTGTTSIQKFLFENRLRLSANGYLFPQSAGYISNHNLVIYGKDKPESDLPLTPLDVSDPVELAQWKERFVNEHTAEVLAFQKQHRDSTVVYSAEHLQSRLIKTSEIKRVARLLRPMFDEIRVLVYLRRQDRYAHSAHSTWVRFGGERDFTFEGVNGDGPYYDYRTLLESWSEVFGEQSIDVRIFEKPRLHNNDLVEDFNLVTGIGRINAEFRRPESVNEALCYTALQILRRFNTLPNGDPRLLGREKEKLREALLIEIQSVSDSYGRFLPERSTALSFYERFRENNQWIAQTWLGNEGFDDSFEEYPERTLELPVIANLDTLLDEQIANCLIPRQKRNAQNGNVSPLAANGSKQNGPSKNDGENRLYAAAPRYARRVHAALRRRLLKVS